VSQDNYDYKMIPDGAMAEAAGRVIPIGLKNDFERERDVAIKRAIKYAFANCGAKEGEMLSDEHGSSCRVWNLSRLSRSSCITCGALTGADPGQQWYPPAL
jgi:hypothetical protein